MRLAIMFPAGLWPVRTPKSFSSSFLMCTSYSPSSYPARFKRSKLSNSGNFHSYKKWTKPIYFDVGVLRQLLDPSGHPQHAKPHPSKLHPYILISTIPYYRPFTRTWPMHRLLTHVQRLYTVNLTSSYTICAWGTLGGTRSRLTFIHSFIFHFNHLQVQPKDVEIVIKCCTIYLLNYRFQMTKYNYNTMIT
jgi:hypothetical protein